MAEPKFDWDKFLAGPIFSTLRLGQHFAWPFIAGTIMLGQFFRLFGWAKVSLLAHFWLCQFCWTVILEGLFLADSAKLFFQFGWAIVDWAENGCG